MFLTKCCVSYNFNRMLFLSGYIESFLGNKCNNKHTNQGTDSTSSPFLSPINYNWNSIKFVHKTRIICIPSPSRLSGSLRAGIPLKWAKSAKQTFLWCLFLYQSRCGFSDGFYQHTLEMKMNLVTKGSCMQTLYCVEIQTLWKTIQ